MIKISEFEEVTHISEMSLIYTDSGVKLVKTTNTLDSIMNTRRMRHKQY